MVRRTEQGSKSSRRLSDTTCGELPVIKIVSIPNRCATVPMTGQEEGGSVKILGQSTAPFLFSNASSTDSRVGCHGISRVKAVEVEKGPSSLNFSVVTF